MVRSAAVKKSGRVFCVLEVSLNRKGYVSGASAREEVSQTRSMVAGFPSCSVYNKGRKLTL